MSRPKPVIPGEIIAGQSTLAWGRGYTDGWRIRREGRLDAIDSIDTVQPYDVGFHAGWADAAARAKRAAEIGSYEEDADEKVTVEPVYGPQQARPSPIGEAKAGVKGVQRPTGDPRTPPVPGLHPARGVQKPKVPRVRW